VLKGATFESVASAMTAALQAKKTAAGDTTPTTPVAIENYAAEVAWPGVGINCNACHVDNSYKTDWGTLGTVVSKQPATEADPNKWLVISPKAASCTACHDSSTAVAHVTSFGSASFADKTQGSRPQETCDDCHASGGFKGVDIVHGQK
jgi:OmcA/MtrC family decaheme c-type cytochrome